MPKKAKVTSKITSKIRVRKVPLKKSKKKLLNKRLVPLSGLVPPSGQPKNLSMNTIVGIFGFAGIIVGVLVYFFFFQGSIDLAPDERPEIVLPDSAGAGSEATPAAGGAPHDAGVVVLKVRILDTPTGYLNVRTGPGTSFEQIIRVNPGESYELVSENAEQTWYEIKLDDATAGWVIKTYAELE